MSENGQERCFKDAVCIDAGRVYDSCCDRDCLEDLAVLFCESDQERINNAVSVRAKSAEINSVYIDVEPETFNKGYYSVDITFYFTVKVDVITAIGAPPVTVTGITYFDKKVILYGSEGSAKIYSSDFVGDDPDEQLPVSANLPKAVVQTVDPIVLAYELKRHPVKCCCRKIPRCVESRAGVSGIGNGDNDSTLFVTLGLFTVVQLIRNVQMLVPVYDFCIPQKECTTTCDSPCDRFSKIKFPTSEFFPPTELSDGTDSGCTACD